MDMGFSEVDSKRALSYFTHGTGIVEQNQPILKERVKKFLNYIAKQGHENRQEILIDKTIENWPQITTIHALMQYGMFERANCL